MLWCLGRYEKITCTMVGEEKREISCVEKFREHMTGGGK